MRTEELIRHLTFAKPATPLSIVYPQHNFQRKDLLPLSPDQLWKIESGVVRTVTWDEEGTQATLGFWGEGDVVGRSLSRMEPYQIRCLTAVKVSELPLANRYLQTALLQNAWKSEELLGILHHQSVRLRLWHFLEWLSLRFGRSLPQGRLTEPRLTHQDIAETIGTSRVTVTRLLNKLEREGQIRRSGQTFLL
jgi:CRP-like cAMP-binding protein